MADITIDKPLANLLCTAITVGFFYKALTEDCYRNRLRVLVESDQNSKADHNKVFKKLNEVLNDINAGFDLNQPALVTVVTKGSDGKVPLPFVIATNRSISNQDAAYINDGLAHLAQYIDSCCRSKLANRPMAGAYIGGIIKDANADSSMVELVGPSQVYVFDNQAVAVVRDAQHDLNTYYASFLEAATNASDFLVNHLVENYYRNHKASLGDNRGDLTKELQDNESKLAELKRQKVAGSIQPWSSTKHLASVHGLVRALNAYKTAQHAACCELALGPDTTKVASCIPCALFGYAIKRPPNFVHLGRGDCWNFPQTGTDQTYYDDWKRFVADCYVKGLKHLGCADPFGGRDDIPEIFLYALTIPDSFVNRMKAYWNL